MKFNSNAAPVSKIRYKINQKQVRLAFAIEVVVVLSSLLGAVLFACQYGHGKSIDMIAMLLAPLGYAVVEFARIPLALAARTHSSRTIRILALVAALGGAGITVKSMSQLGELMFRPRLAEASQAHDHLLQAQQAKANLLTMIKQADDAVILAKEAVGGSEALVAQAGNAITQISAGHCDRHRCHADPRTTILSNNLKAASRNLTDAQNRFEAAKVARQSISTASVDATVTTALSAYHAAVEQSQIHSFVGMVFGKDAADVSEGEIAQFLRIFIFVPAILVSLVSMLLTLTSVTALPQAAKKKVVTKAAPKKIAKKTKKIVVQEVAKAQPALRLVA